jgi:hypothetical protein
MTISVKVDRVKSLQEIVRRMGDKSVTVGIRGGGERAPVAGESSHDGLTNAQIGYINEFGSAVENIPARPFLMPAVTGTSADVKKILDSNSKVIFETLDAGMVDAALGKVGEHVKQTAKKNITKSVGMKPLSKRTLKERKERGFSGTKPLIESGQLVNSIDYVVS